MIPPISRMLSIWEGPARLNSDGQAPLVDVLLPTKISRDMILRLTQNGPMAQRATPVFAPFQELQQFLTYLCLLQRVHSPPLRAIWIGPRNQMLGVTRRELSVMVIFNVSALREECANGNDYGLFYVQRALASIRTNRYGDLTQSTFAISQVLFCRTG